MIRQAPNPFLHFFLGTHGQGGPRAAKPHGTVTALIPFSAI